MAAMDLHAVEAGTLRAAGSGDESVNHGRNFLDSQGSCASSFIRRGADRVANTG